MHTRDKNKVKLIVEKLQSLSNEIELLIQSEDNRLANMDNRKRILGNKEYTIETNKICMDSARLSIEDAIEDISKVLE
jgi:hypothetical protein